MWHLQQPLPPHVPPGDNCGVAVAPVCTPGQKAVHGVARQEEVEVSCDVVASPADNITFHWSFTKGDEKLDMQQSQIRWDTDGDISLWLTKTIQFCGIPASWLNENISDLKEKSYPLCAVCIIFCFYYYITFYRVNGTRSILDYVPRTEMDYGNVLCWATNPVGRQSEPCVYHIIPAGKLLQKQKNRSHLQHIFDPFHNC